MKKCPTACGHWYAKSPNYREVKLKILGLRPFSSRTLGSFVNVCCVFVASAAGGFSLFLTFLFLRFFLVLDFCIWCPFFLFCEHVICFYGPIYLTTYQPCSRGRTLAVALFDAIILFVVILALIALIGQGQAQPLPSIKRVKNGGA